MSDNPFKTLWDNDRAMREIESLRQQLAERDKHIAALRKVLIEIHKSLDALNDTESKP